MCAPVNCRKKKYATKGLAEVAKVKGQAFYGVIMATYECKVCNQWHLTLQREATKELSKHDKGIKYNKKMQRAHRNLRKRRNKGK